MIDVGVGEEDSVDLGGGEGEMFVAIGGFGAAALIHATVEDEAAATGLNFVQGAGDSTRGPAEGNLHDPMSVPCYSEFRSLCGKY